MKVTRKKGEMKIAAMFVFLVAALLLSANMTSKVNLSSVGLGATFVQAEEPPTNSMNNSTGGEEIAE